MVTPFASPCPPVQWVLQITGRRRRTYPKLSSPCSNRWSRPVLPGPKPGLGWGGDVFPPRADERSWAPPTPTSAQRAWRRAISVPELWLAILGIGLYAPPAMRVAQLSPDAVEYIDIARRLAAGEGFLLGIKAYHVGGNDILHDGMAERAPLYPILAALLLRTGAGLAGLQFANVVLAGLCIVLVCGLGRTLFGRQVGVLTGLLAVASPVLLVRLVPPMTEALSASLTLLAVWLVTRFGSPPRAAAFVSAGAALGLAYLMRPTVAALAVALPLGWLLMRCRGQALGRPLAAFGVGVLAFVAPVSVYSLLTRGTLSYSGQSYLYAVFRDADVLRNGFRGPLPTPLEFVTDNAAFVVAAIAENTRSYSGLLLFDVDWLLPLAPAWPVALWMLARGRYPRRVWPALVVAAINFLTYAATWANFQERYQLMTLMLLLPFAVHGLSGLGLDRLVWSFGPIRTGRITLLHLVVLAVVFVWSATLVRQYGGTFTYGGEPVGTRTDRDLRWTGPPRWVQDGDLTRLLDWIDARTEVDDSLAHGQPWPLTFFTGRSSTLLPIRLDQPRLQQFVEWYRVGYVVIDTRDRDRRGYQGYLEALSGLGVRWSAVGAYRVFDTRALWRRA